MNAVFREKKAPWVLLAVMASKALWVYLVLLVLRVPQERMETRYSPM